MANIRQRIGSVEEILGKIWCGTAPASRVEGILDWADSELNVVERILEEGGESDAPICCFTVEEGQIGCGRYVDSAHEEFFIDILAPLDEFVRHCKKCRRATWDELWKNRGEVGRARALHNLPLEEILEDLEKLNFAQKEIQHLHQPVISNDDLEREMRKIVPYAQSLPYHGGKFEDELEHIYFALGGNDTSTYQGGGWIRIAQSSRGQSSIYAELAHEIAHLLVGVLGANEATVMVLGLETSAAMTLAGDKNHEISLYRTMKNLAAYSAYVKTMRIGQVSRWREFMGGMYPSELVDQIERGYRGCFVEEFGDEAVSFKTPLSQYMLVPYLALKGALKENRDFLPRCDIYKKDVDIPALVESVRRVWA